MHTVILNKDLNNSKHTEFNIFKSNFIYFNFYGNSAYLLFRNILMLLGQNPRWLMSQRERKKLKKLL